MLKIIQLIRDKCQQRGATECYRVRYQMRINETVRWKIILKILRLDGEMLVVPPLLESITPN